MMRCCGLSFQRFLVSVLEAAVMKDVLVKVFSCMSSKCWREQFGSINYPHPFATDAAIWMNSAPTDGACGFKQHQQR